MKRREFVGASVAASLLGSSLSVEGFNENRDENRDDQPKPEYYELRLYHLRRGPQVKALHDFFAEVALPAMKRNGLGPIGCFEVLTGPDSPTIYMLIPHKSIDSFSTASSRVNADVDYQKAALDFLNAPSNAPAYQRIESSLMVAFDSFPKLQVPAAATGNKPRIFELRTYESHSRKASKKKIEMFGMGEIAIFKRTGLQPVFFGETMIGTRLPNLTYMLTFDNLAAREKNWSVFGADPDWKKLSTMPGYADADVVSNITSSFLRPTPYSQI